MGGLLVTILLLRMLYMELPIWHMDIIVLDMEFTLVKPISSMGNLANAGNMAGRVLSMGGLLAQGIAAVYGPPHVAHGYHHFGHEAYFGHRKFKHGNVANAGNMASLDMESLNMAGKDRSDEVTNILNIYSKRGPIMGGLLVRGVAAATAVYGAPHMAHVYHHFGYGAYFAHGKFKHGRFGHGKFKHGWKR
ncbi:hypothetical protein VNO78_25884 [Psophocarpus tetragonolobus]|uniref:Uncharacterized protein n=1 Tax=Psophocarpus tetragonolobus TaxID=3891 RepID=A0AAN9S870_PSOTE